MKVKLFKQQRQNIQIIKQFAKTDFKLRYNSSILGYLWSLLKPLSIFLILNFVFSNIFGKTDPHYSLKLLTSIIIWNFFAEGTMTGLTSIQAKSGILTKIYIPKWTIIVAATSHILITYCLNIAVLICFFIFYQFFPNFWDILMFIYYSILTYILILSISLITAPLNIRFRDLHQIWEVLLVGGFYAAPIIYPMEVIPEFLHWILQINPMTFIIQYTQYILFSPDFSLRILPNLIYLGFIATLFAIAVFSFKKLSTRIIEEI